MGGLVNVGGVGEIILFEIKFKQIKDISDTLG